MAESKDSLPREQADSPNFEDSFHRLSEMAEQLEAGGLTLAEATSRFEEGMKLVQFCNDLLNNAELKITELKEAYRADRTQPGVDNFGDDHEEGFGE